jgi:DNA-binding beta-propeller fold protein YncE
VADINSVAPLTSISLVDGARTELAPAVDVGGLAIAADLARDRVYAVTFEGVDEVVLSNPPSKTNISVVAPTEPLIFSQGNSIGIDLVNDRIIVGDYDLDALIAVDRVTGQRSELLSRKLGAGPPLIAPRRLAVTADGAAAYVVDDGGNAAERLFEVDLVTGDRRAVGQIHEPGVNRSVPGLALDELNGHAYVARFDRGTVLRVDLETQNVEAITSDLEGLLDGIEDIVLDGAEGRLLVADSVTDSIVAVDLVTRQQQLISRAGARGAGPAFETLASLTLGPDGTAVYAADQLTDQILRVDLESGDREVMATACGFASPEGLRQVLYDEVADELLILSANGMFIHDFETSGCARVPVPIGMSTLGIQLTPDGRILGAAFHSVTQIDRKTGAVVIVSK